MQSYAMPPQLKMFHALEEIVNLLNISVESQNCYIYEYSALSYTSETAL